MHKMSWFAIAATYSQFSNIADRCNSQFSNIVGWYKLALCPFGRGHHGNRHQVAHSCADCRFAWKQSRQHLQRDPLYAPLLCYFEYQKPVRGGNKANDRFVHTEVIGHRTDPATPPTVRVVAKCEWRRYACD